jgi:hypothetical protein
VGDALLRLLPAGAVAGGDLHPLERAAFHGAHPMQPFHGTASGAGSECKAHIASHGGGYAIPTILVTAYPYGADRARAMNDGVVCYARKPFPEQH